MTNLPKESYDKNRLADLDKAISSAKMLIDSGDQLNISEITQNKIDISMNIEEQRKHLNEKINKLAEQLFGELTINKLDNQINFINSFKILPNKENPNELVIYHFDSFGVVSDSLFVDLIYATAGPLNIPKELIVSCIDIVGKKINTINELPEHLEELYCFSIKTQSISYLPDSLIKLNCSSNDLTTLPKLPSHLKVLNCRYNNLTSIPELPNSLELLNVADNWLTTLPALPASLNLDERDFSNNPLDEDSVSKLTDLGLIEL